MSQELELERVETEIFSIDVPTGWEDTTRLARMSRDECVFDRSRVIPRSGLIGKLADALRRRPEAGIAGDVIDLGVIPGDLSSTERDEVIFDANLEWVGGTDEHLLGREKQLVDENDRFAIRVKVPTAWGEPSEIDARMTVTGDTGVLIACWSLGNVAKQYRPVFEVVHQSLVLN